MNQILFIGSVSKDVFLPTSKGVVIETPQDLTSQKKITFELGAKYQIDDRYEAPGGVAANAAQGVARLGIQAGLYSKIGDDELGKWILNEIEEEGVDVSNLQVENGVRSDLSAIIVDSNGGDHTIFFNRDANEKLVIDPEKMKNTEWFFISSLNGTKEKTWIDLLDEILAVAKDLKIKIAFNPGQRNIKDSPEKIVEAIKNSKIVILNKDEAIEIISKGSNSGSNQLNDEKFLIKELKNFGPEIIVMTNGLNGAWAYDGRELVYTKSSENHPTETTGAGDSFSSGFMAAHLKGKSIHEALQWGSANGGNVVRFYGAKEGLLKEDKMIEEAKNIQIENVNN